MLDVVIMESIQSITTMVEWCGAIPRPMAGNTMRTFSPMQDKPDIMSGGSEGSAREDVPPSMPSEDDGTMIDHFPVGL